MTIDLTERELEVLIMILSVDLDALGLERSEQGAARSALRKLQRRLDEQSKPRSDQ